MLKESHKLVLTFSPFSFTKYLRWSQNPVNIQFNYASCKQT